MMNARVLFIMLMLFGTNFSSLKAQDTRNQKAFDTFFEDWFFDFGVYNSIPTSSIFLSSWRSNDNGVKNKSLTNEWNLPRSPGAYIELSKGVNDNKPVFIGFGFRTQSLYKRSVDRQDIPVIDGFEYRPINWAFENNARKMDYRFFLEYPLLFNDKFSLYSRGDIGLSNFRNRVQVKWQQTGTYVEDSTHEQLKKEGALVFSIDLGLGVRWEFSDGIALKGQIGYQFQSSTDFSSYSQIDGLDSSVNFSGPLPEEGDFVLLEPNNVNNSGIQYEHLNMQIGLSISFDKLFSSE